MSRKLTRESVRKFLDGIPFKKSNTEVSREGAIYYLKLFGNKIAAKDTDGKIWIAVNKSTWFTNTTKERLNAIPNVHIVQKNGNWYLNGNLWQGEPNCVS
jgi:hypothetical protein